MLRWWTISKLMSTCNASFFIVGFRTPCIMCLKGLLSVDYRSHVANGLAEAPPSSQTVLSQAMCQKLAQHTFHILDKVLNLGSKRSNPRPTTQGHHCKAETCHFSSTMHSFPKKTPTLNLREITHIHQLSNLVLAVLILQTHVILQKFKNQRGLNFY